MPMYDFECLSHAHQFEALTGYEMRGFVSCPECGSRCRQIWTGRTAVMIPDSIPGGRLIENLTPQPKRYYSRTEIKDEMRARGVRPMVRHVGDPGSDKSKHTQRWV